MRTLEEWGRQWLSTMQRPRNWHVVFLPLWDAYPSDDDLRRFARQWLDENPENAAAENVRLAIEHGQP